MAFPFTLLIYMLPTLTLVLAQPPWQSWSGFGDMSNCGQGCFFQNIRGSGCQFPNFGCVCNAEDFIPNLTTCVNSQCNATEADQVLQAANSLCDSVDATSSILPLASSSTSAPTSRVSTIVSASTTVSVSTTTQTRQSTFSTLATKSSTQPDDTSITMSPDVQPSASGTTSPPETQPTASTTNDATTTPIGAIVGGVVGGFGGVSLILAMVWLIMREKNKGASMKAFPHLMPQPPHTNQAEEQSQSIWDGRQAFIWNPRANYAAELPSNVQGTSR